MTSGACVSATHRRHTLSAAVTILFCALNGVAVLVLLTVDAVTGGSLTEGAV
ncbi:hypothetical protein [Streptomyces sp. NPDC056527]|uniref:hypothetical protein n=1 Tax=Streptomyces sp. NPDC056527 TaxID=3345853 RepID=UPI0036B066F0